MNILFSDSRDLASRDPASQELDTREQVNRAPDQRDKDNLLLNDRGYLFGDGFFTTGIIKSGELSHYQYHFERFKEAATRLKFNRFNPDFLISKRVSDFLKPIELAGIRFTITRQQVKRGYAYALDADFNISVQVFALPELPKNYCLLTFADTPVSCNPVFAGLKHLNRLDNVFAASEILSERQETLLCHKNSVICGSRSNLFIRQNDRWLTPKLDTAGINGITRQRILKMMGEKGIEHLECDITREQVENSSAAFITNSLLGLWIVDNIAGKSISTLASEKLKLALSFER